MRRRRRSNEEEEEQLEATSIPLQRPAERIIFEKMHVIHTQPIIASG